MDDNERPPVAVSADGHPSLLLLAVFFVQDDPQKPNRPALRRGPLLTATCGVSLGASPLHCSSTLPPKNRCDNTQRLARLSAVREEVQHFRLDHSDGFPTVPVIKIASNSHTYTRMRDNMDFNAGPIADGEQTIRQAGEQIFELLLRVASGEKTASERRRHREFVPWRIGPVM